MNSGGGSAAPVDVAIAGLGRAAFSEHLPFFDANRGLFRIIAACDLSKERRDRFAAVFPGARLFKYIDDMLDESDIELMVVSVPSKEHVAFASASLKKGFWTAVESPIAATAEDVNALRAAAERADGRLLPILRGLTDPGFALAAEVAAGGRLGALHRVSIVCDDYLRRNDWQATKTAGGGAAMYAMPDMVCQALRFAGSPPVKMWSELKRIASVGDAEDFVHVRFKTRSQLTMDVEYNGGRVPCWPRPTFVLEGARGAFRVMPGERSGTLALLDLPASRRRKSVRTPPLSGMREETGVALETVSLPEGTPDAVGAFWRRVHDTVRGAKPFHIRRAEAFEALRLSLLARHGGSHGG